MALLSFKPMFDYSPSLVKDLMATSITEFSNPEVKKRRAQIEGAIDQQTKRMETAQESAQQQAQRDTRSRDDLLKKLRDMNLLREG